MEIFETKTDIGLIREKNEDAVLCLKHPKNKNVKLLLVADGMGGKNYGDVAANYVVDSLGNWFKEKEIKILNDTELTEKLLKRYIKSLNKRIINKFGENNVGTTLTLALINSKETLIINVGDSRTYIYKEKKLIQLTEDDADVWMYYKYGGVKKDDLRFFAINNVINSCIGINDSLCKISTITIKNNYEMILLFSDGVTDMITDKKITSLINKTPKEALLTKIINEAVHVNQNFHVPLRLKRKYKTNYIIPFKGRDNASGAIYIKNA